MSRHTPAPHDLFMTIWHNKAFESSRGPGEGWSRKELLYWGKVWADCCELAGVLNELEERAEAAEASDKLNGS